MSIHASHPYPRRVNYTLEVLREGSVVDTRELAGQHHYTMGRTPDNGAEIAEHAAPIRCLSCPKLSIVHDVVRLAQTLCWSIRPRRGCTR